MIKRKSSYPIQKNENMRGGDGVVVIEHLLSPDELYDKGRLYAKITIDTGCSIGYHVHEGEMESFYIVSGEAEVSDNGEIARISAGDTLLTRSGDGHSIKNIGAETLEFIAQIIFDGTSS